MSLRDPCSTSRSLPFGSQNPLFSRSTLLSTVPLPDRNCHRLFGRLEEQGKEREGEREEVSWRINDFEIFVARHKFGGGGLAYLNMDRTFSFLLLSSSSSCFLFLFLPLPLHFFFILRSFSFSFFFFFSLARREWSSCSKLAADSYLTASLLLPRFSSPSFRVPTSIVFGALINYPGATPCRYPLSLLLFLLASTRNESGKDSPRARALWSLKFSIG